MITQMARYYHIGLTIPPGVDQNAVYEQIHTKSLDWMRYAPNCYIIWSTSPSAELAGAILGVAGMSNGNFLIVDVNLLQGDGFGWLPGWAWDWIKKDRSSPPAMTLGDVLKLIPPPANR